MKFLQPALLIMSTVSITALSACGSSSSDDDDSAILPEASDSSSQTSAPAPGSEDNPGPTGNNNLNGTWLLPNCDFDDDDFFTAKLEITNDLGVRTESYFTDSDCSQVAEPAELALTFSLEFPEGSVGTSLGNALFINSTLESAALDGDPIASELINTVEYDIFLVVDQQLYTGDLDQPDQDGSSPASRPRMLLTSEPYTRQ